MKNQILRIASPAQIPFVAVGNAKSISVIKNDSIIEIHNIGFNENFSTATQPSVQIGGVNYAIWAKVDNSNPFSLFPDNAIGISHMILLDVTGNLLTFINMAIGYDGVNTYLMSDNFTNPDKKAGTSIPTIHLYNSQPK
ncbi:MAG: hypothetical protein HFI31_14245 [Lachnospiraceae bacterium]|nr:hypothetical protein [Lachnospiraceae bacterium]